MLLADFVEKRYTNSIYICICHLWQWLYFLHFSALTLWKHYVIINNTVCICKMFLDFYRKDLYTKSLWYYANIHSICLSCVFWHWWYAYVKVYKFYTQQLHLSHIGMATSLCVMSPQISTLFLEQLHQKWTNLNSFWCTEFWISFMWLWNYTPPEKKFILGNCIYCHTHTVM